MIELELAGLATARVRFSAGMTLPFSRCLARSVRAGSNRQVGPTHVGIEAVVPLGGHAQYGFLGFDYVPRHGGGIDIEVPHLDTSTRPWSHALVEPPDRAHLGLLREFAEPILAATAAFAEHHVPPGTLRVVEAAHAEIGSSPWFFEHIAIACLQLVIDPNCRSRDAIAELLNRELVTCAATA